MINGGDFFQKSPPFSQRFDYDRIEFACRATRFFDYTILIAVIFAPVRFTLSPETL